jgi:hypothetical protein
MSALGSTSQYLDPHASATALAVVPLFFTVDGAGFIETTEDANEATHMWAMGSNGFLDFVPIGNAAPVAVQLGPPEWVMLLRVPDSTYYKQGAVTFTRATVAFQLEDV